MAKKDKPLLLSSNVVEKRNILNEMWAIGWTLQELRFFALYLSRINSRKAEKTRVVQLSLHEFAEVMGLKRVQPKDIDTSTNSLLQKIACVPNYDKNGAITSGFSKFQIFKKCKLEKNEYDEWYIEFNAHDEALPLMFDFKEKYVTYRVINVLRLKGENHIRMYEILKQYEKVGKLTLPIAELRGRLGIEPNEYERWDNFRAKVLETCKKALAEHTDIVYTYEPIKRGRGGKTSPVVAVAFTIKQNTAPEQLSLLDPDVVGFTTENNVDEPICESKPIISTHSKDDRTAELRQAKKSEMWYFALEIARKTIEKSKNIKVTPERYAIGILKKWTEEGCKTASDLIESGHIARDDAYNKPTFDYEALDAFY